MQLEMEGKTSGQSNACKLEEECGVDTMQSNYQDQSQKQETRTRNSAINFDIKIESTNGQGSNNSTCIDVRKSQHQLDKTFNEDDMLADLSQDKIPTIQDQILSEETEIRQPSQLKSLEHTQYNMLFQTEAPEQ